MILFLDTEFTGPWTALATPDFHRPCVRYFTPAKPEHHALYDAWALRRAWQRAKPLDDIQALNYEAEAKVNVYGVRIIPGN